jgi:hypothetical protein
VRFLAENLSDFIAEGVRVDGAIRRGLEIDVLIWLRQSQAPRTKAQIRMGEQVDRRIAELVPILSQKGAVIIESR